ncbi:MAG: PAS domain-containing protein [Alphaproteobacteria bacterium]|nr:PAS domain-containing protein [Alphaproteobacteria bacterium]MDX5417342.1 PAS domain-containing protein [Alphaproteobacteria bacterium]MDX5494798.1 PAS domain-containing protein [Alphaproteobacteria bacterium]
MLSSSSVSNSLPRGHALRSPESIAFEEAWEAVRQGDGVPRRADIDLRRFASFVRWFAIIEPDPNEVALPFRLTGSGFREFFGRDLTGIDYLSLADPAIRAYAYECVMACLRHPCGLWQCTPATAENGGRIDYEYTILPISKAGGAPDHIGIFVNFEAKPTDDLPGVQRIEHSTVWHWLDIGAGVPPASIGNAPF